MMFKISKRRKAILAVASMLASAPLGISSASAQGMSFLSALFGGGQTEGRSAYAPDPRPLDNLLPGYRNDRRPLGTLDPSDPSLRREMERRAHAARPKSPGQDEGGGSRGKMAAIAPTADAPNGSLALFMKDKTLRAGDVVVTNAGFRVFEGHGGKAAKDDFVAINSSESPKTDRASLARLEQVSRMRTPNTTVETVADAKPVLTPEPAKADRHGKLAPGKAVVQGKSVAPGKTGPEGKTVAEGTTTRVR